MTIHFRAINKENWRIAYKLSVKDEQRNLIAHNGWSILQTVFETEYGGVALGIYKADEMVGFMMTGIFPHEEPSIRWINRFMIGAEYQGKGYGREALRLYLQQIKDEGQYQQVKISYKPHNHIARKLYLSLGFVEIGMHPEWDEMVAVYNTFSP